MDSHGLQMDARRGFDSASTPVLLAILRTNGALHTAASAFDVDQLLLRIMWYGMGQGQWTLHLWREDTTADGLSRLDATVDGSKKYR
jgi:hypothetical protein